MFLKRAVLAFWLISDVLALAEADYFNLTLLRKGIIDYLNLPDRQQTLDHESVPQAAPEFMKSLYRMKVQNALQSEDKPQIQQLQQDNVVRFFYPKDQRARKTNTLRFEFNFNLSSSDNNEIITNAVLRVHRRRTKMKKAVRLCSVALFLQHPRVRRRKGNKLKNKAPIFVAIKIVPLSGKPLWVQFNVFKAIKDYQQNHPNKLIHFKLFVVAYGTGLPSKGWIRMRGKNRPNLIVYSRRNPAMRTSFSLDLTALNDIIFNLPDIPVKSRAKRGNSDEFCQLRHLYVKFRSLKINWIVAPLGFSAYVCEGTCPEVLTSNFNPNNHAILQNLLHYRYSKNVPSVSCVPTKLTSLTLLFRDESSDSFALKEFPNMVASSCGCR